MKDDTNKIIDKNLLVYNIEPNDVLLGRGSPIVNNKGNIRFRKVVNSRKADYMKSTHHDIKNKIANEVIETITLKNGGRFLRKVEHTHEVSSLGISILGKESSVWVIVDEHVTLQKVKQALREQGGLKKLSSSVKTNNNKDQKPSLASTTTKDDHSMSNETTLRYATLPTANATRELQQELHQRNTNNSTNRLTYEDLLLTSARHELEKQALLGELLKRRQIEADNAVHLGFTRSSVPPSHNSSNIMMVADDCYYRAHNYARPAAVTSEMIGDNTLLNMLRPRNSETMMISDMFKNKQMNGDVDNNNLNVKDLLYELQRRQAIDTTSSLYDRVTLLSNSSLSTPQRGINNGLNSMMSHSNQNSIDMELLLLSKKREIYNDMLLTNQSITKRRRTDEF